MVARRKKGAQLSALLMGLFLVLAACERPQSAGIPEPSVSPSAESGGSEASPEPTPATGNVQPIITF